MVAMPKKAKNPAISVTVVRIIDDDVAGSCPSLVKITGMMAPAKPAATIASTIDHMITATRPIDWLQI